MQRGKVEVKRNMLGVRLAQSVYSPAVNLFTLPTGLSHQL